MPSGWRCFIGVITGALVGLGTAGALALGALVAAVQLDLVGRNHVVEWAVVGVFGLVGGWHGGYGAYFQACEDDED